MSSLVVLLWMWILYAHIQGNNVDWGCSRTDVGGIHGTLSVSKKEETVEIELMEEL